LRNSNVINTKRYIWHLAEPTVRYSIIDEGLLASKSEYRAVFASNETWIPCFYPFHFDIMCKGKCWEGYDYWRIDTFKLKSLWLADPNRCHGAKWVCTVDDIPVSALELFKFTYQPDKDCSDETCSVKFLTNETEINSFIKWRVNNLKSGSF